MSKVKPKVIDYTVVADPKVCTQCRYHAWASNVVICYYILHTGKRRGCPAGKCTKFEPYRGMK